MKDLTTGNTYKKFFAFALPLILSGFLSNSFNMINQILSGQFLGEYGLAVSGSISGFTSLYSCTLGGFATGFVVLLTQLHGEKDYRGMKSVILSNAVMLFSVTTTLGVLLAIFSDYVMEYLNVNEKIRPITKSYFCITVVPYFLIAFRVWGHHIMVALGQTKFAFKISISTTLLSIILKIISLKVFNLGILSLVVNTQIISFFMDMIYIFKLRKCFKEMDAPKEKIRFNKKLFKESLTMGIPSSFQQMIMYLVTFLISPLVNGIGPAATAAYSVIGNIQHLSNTIYQNTSKALTNYCAQCIGKRKFGQIKKGVWISFVQSVTLVVPIIICCAIFATPLCKMYFKNGYKGESLNYCVLFIRFYQPLVVFNLINNMFHSFYRGVRAPKLLVASTFVNSVTRVLITAIIVSEMGMKGIFFGWVTAWIVESIFNGIIFFTGVWKKEKINKIIKEEGLTV